MSQAIASFPLDFNPTAATPRAAEPARTPREAGPVLAALPLVGPADWQPRRSKRLLLPVLGLHAVMAWGLVQMGVVPMPSRPAPVEVKLLTVAPPKAPPPAVRPALAPQFQQLTVPPVEAPVVQVAPSPVVAVVAENPPPRPMVVATPAQAPAGPGPAQSGPREVSASAVQYLQAPPIAVPAMSRRLGERGTVVLRVLVDRDGLPRQITLHQSSGFARLDEQAQQAMRAARFKPHTENGEPVEMLVLTPIQYELGR